MSKVYLGNFDSYDDEKLTDFFRQFSEIYSQRIKSASTILIKPNILMKTDPAKGITTHPEFLDGLISVLKENTEAELVLGDSPGANFGNFEKVLEVTGISEVAAKHGVKTLKIESYNPINKDGCVYSSLAEEVDLIINVPKLKTHSLTGLTLAVKNLFGLVPGNTKVGYHRDYPVDSDLADAIYNLYEYLKDKTLHILDGIIAHQGNGPSGGEPVVMNMSAFSDDGVALDYVVTEASGHKAETCLTTKSAIKKGYDVKSILALGEVNAPKIKLSDSKRGYIPVFLKKYLASMVYSRPYIIQEKCIKCLLCLKSCPVEAITYKNKSVLLDNKKCIECYCCHEVCESDAVGLNRSFLHRMFVR